MLQELPQGDDVFVGAGYIRVFQDERGKYGSEGNYLMTPPLVGPLNTTGTDDSTDAYDTIDWLVKNVPESNGKVGMIGSSYEGFTVVMALINPHPALKVAAPESPMVDGWMGDDWFHYGAFRQNNLDYFTGQSSARGRGRLIPREGLDDYTNYLQIGSAGDFARTVAGGVLSDVYEPTIDNTDVSTLQYVVTDGATFSDLQTRDMTYTVAADRSGMACTVTSTDAKHGFRLVTTYITYLAGDTVLMQTKLEGSAANLKNLHLYARLDAHVNGNGQAVSTPRQLRRGRGELRILQRDHLRPPRQCDAGDADDHNLLEACVRRLRSRSPGGSGADQRGVFPGVR